MLVFTCHPWLSVIKAELLFSDCSVKCLLSMQSMFDFILRLDDTAIMVDTAIILKSF